MMRVLIIDESPLFREYLRLKLQENNIEVSIGVNAPDGITKMRNLLPDLVILDSGLSRREYLDVLKEKRASPNAANIPLILMAQRVDPKRLIELAPYNIKKVFSKPVKIDTLFATLAETLRLPFKIDESPGIVEVHVNDHIVFIEIAQGLNRDKLDLLRFKIIELIELYEIRFPKVIVMLSDISLGSADSLNFDRLLMVVKEASRAKNKYIKILTKDDFAGKFIKSQKIYAGLEVVSGLQQALDGLAVELDYNLSHGEKGAEVIGEKVLSAENAKENEDEALALQFNADSGRRALDTMKESMKNLRIAAVDDDFIIQELLKNTFRETGASVKTFSDGEEFLLAADTGDFDLVFLDLIMPKKDGFAVLEVLREKNVKYPVIVLSAVTERETVIKAYLMGIKSYLVKPLKPGDIFKKSMEILKPSF